MKVEGHVNLKRDDNNNAIVNTSSSEYNNYISLRKKKRQGSNRIDNMEHELKNLKDDINEIKNLLRALSNG
jgi:wobble nucleotide-excising tRNase|tara:strand:- start:36 stop:248 length:213 start_codon:yes stop_codon:yes gene_type:complete